MVGDFNTPIGVCRIYAGVNARQHLVPSGQRCIGEDRPITWNAVVGSVCLEEPFAGCLLMEEGRQFGSSSGLDNHPSVVSLDHVSLLHH
jgi:hypothetical protein